MSYPEAPDAEALEAALDFFYPTYRSDQSRAHGKVGDIQAHRLAVAMRAFANEARRKQMQDVAPAWEARGTAWRMVCDAVKELGPVGALDEGDSQGDPPDPIRDAERLIVAIQKIAALEESGKLPDLAALLSSDDALIEQVRESAAWESVQDEHPNDVVYDTLYLPGIVNATLRALRKKAGIDG
jgi:hypothetical protein